VLSTLPGTDMNVLIRKVNALGNSVGGISRESGAKAVFIRGALPGETVSCKPVREAGNFIEAELIEVLEPSPHRVKPFCVYFGTCGGCSLQHLEYPMQLYWKKRWVTKALDRMNIEPDYGVTDRTLQSPLTRGYRNRVSFDMTSMGPGLHAYKGDPFPVDDCPLLNESGRKVYAHLAGKPLPGCRRISVRASPETGTSIVEFSPIPAGGIPHLGGETAAAWKSADGWEGSGGRVSFKEKLPGITFTVFAGTFFQVNTPGAAILAARVMKLLPPGGDILDLYGGCGTFALHAARLGGRVVSVEFNTDSSEGGRISARENGITGVEFVTGRVRKFLVETTRSRHPWDAVIVDPPRSGLGIRNARSLRRVNSPLIVYVSCNPFTLARDLSIITGGGWEVATVTTVDMFPQTDHVETVTEIRRRKPE